VNKPKLVLHICCAPDEAIVIKRLNETHELFCYFCNPNIQPEDEYIKRLDEARKVAAMFDVPFESDSYDPESWEQAVTNYTETSEGGTRCQKCFDLRLMRTAQFCKSIGWETFTTVMSVSPHKNIKMLDEAGKNAASSFGVAYESFNFKKNNGFLESIKLSDELGLYRQDYCGCRLSRTERDRRKEKSL